MVGNRVERGMEGLVVGDCRIVVGVRERLGWVIRDRGIIDVGRTVRVSMGGFRL